MRTFRVKTVEGGLDEDDPFLQIMDSIVGQRPRGMSKIFRKGAVGKGTVMDKIFSTRIDEDLVRRVDRFAKERSISKKRILEQALREYLDRFDPEHGMRVLDRSFGAWKRKETIGQTWKKGRSAFKKAFQRHSTARIPK